MKKEQHSKEYYSLAQYYDRLYNEKNYSDEATFFTKLIKKYKKSKGNDLLDVACGTGSHISYFKKDFEAKGIDISNELITIARDKNPDVDFEVADITKFKSSEKFDVVTCLFSSIAYIKSGKDLKEAINIFFNNLKTGGVLLIETLYLKDKFSGIENHTRFYKDKNIALKRTTNISADSDTATIKSVYEITENGEAKKIINDEHILQLHDERKLISLMEDIGFQVKIFNYKKTGTTIFLGMKA